MLDKLEMLVKSKKADYLKNFTNKIILLNFNCFLM